MTKYLLYILGACGLLIAACSRDKGNYDYVELPDPAIRDLDTAYSVITGDSLIITPHISLASGKDDYQCYWKIDWGEKATSLEYEGRELRIVFGLPSGRYPGQLAVMDNVTGMKYFYRFVITCQTEFTKGALVLSSSGGTAALTFIKPDGTVQPDVYQAINQESLQGAAMQLVPVQNMFYLNRLTSYWVTYTNGGVMIDADNLQRIRTLRENFYEQPSAVQPEYFMNMPNGVTHALMNGKLYFGATETAPFWPYYGFYGVPIPGNYKLFPLMVHNAFENPNNTYFVGFEPAAKRLVRFYKLAYYGTGYAVTNGVFDPKDLKMDLLHLDRFSDNDLYAFGDSAGKKIELKFRVEFNDSTQRFTPDYTREFPGASLLTAGTVWRSSPIGVFFFTSNERIYRYNPLNQELRELEANLGGKKVTMLKVQRSGNLLVAGVEGSIFYLDISTGKLGQVLAQYDGIPGIPKDVIVRD
jgi:hypothetical protein